MPAALSIATSGKADHAPSGLAEAVALMQQARAQLAEATRILETIKRRMQGEAEQLSVLHRPACGDETHRAEQVTAARL
jgi:hypothetical protein